MLPAMSEGILYALIGINRVAVVSIEVLYEESENMRKYQKRHRVVAMMDNIDVFASILPKYTRC